MPDNIITSNNTLTDQYRTVLANLRGLLQRKADELAPNIPTFWEVDSSGTLGYIGFGTSLQDQNFDVDGYVFRAQAGMFTLPTAADNFIDDIARDFLTLNAPVLARIEVERKFPSLRGTENASGIDGGVSDTGIVGQPEGAGAPVAPVDGAADADESDADAGEAAHVAGGSFGEGADASAGGSFAGQKRGKGK